MTPLRTFRSAFRTLALSAVLAGSAALATVPAGAQGTAPTPRPGEPAEGEREGLSAESAVHERAEESANRAHNAERPDHAPVDGPVEADHAEDTRERVRQRDQFNRDGCAKPCRKQRSQQAANAKADDRCCGAGCERHGEDREHEARGHSVTGYSCAG